MRGLTLSEKRDEKVSGGDTGKGGVTNPAGESQRTLSREYTFSRWAIPCRLKEPVLPKTGGRKPAKALAKYNHENKRLKMENELLRDFLCSTGREAKGKICSDLPAQKRISGSRYVSLPSGIPKRIL